LNSQTDDKMQKSDARLLAAARAGYLCGAHDIVFHPASYHTQPPEDVYPRVRDQLLQIVETLQSEGVTVNLRPETMGKSAMFGTLAETVRLSADIPHVLPCIDWAHLYARDGKGSFNTPDHFRAALDLVGEQLGEHGLKQVHFHISGIDYTPKGERAHIPMYQSVQRFPELFDLFVEYELAGTVGVEAPEPFHTADALTMQALYRHRRDLLAGKGTQRAEDADDE
jgi:deoxyribonuclease-4